MKEISKFVAIIVLLFTVTCTGEKQGAGILNVVEKTVIRNDSADITNPLSEGNGTLYFTFDITGLQTFPDDYSHGNPLVTLLRTKDGCFSTGRIGLEIKGKDSNKMTLPDIKDISQELRLSSGLADSRFRVFGNYVHVITLCHPNYNMISVKISSGLIQNQRLKIIISTPEDSANGMKAIVPALTADSNNVAIITASNRKTPYRILIWKNNAEVRMTSPGMFYIEPPAGDTLYSFSCQFLVNDSTGRIQTFGETERASSKIWKRFWTGRSFTGKVGNSSGREDERSFILTQYFNRIRTCGRQD